MQGNKGLRLKTAGIFIFLLSFLYALEPVQPIKPVPYNHQKAILGKMLFFDPSLSADGKISCASCHNPKYGGADNKKFSIGVFGRVDGPMNSPTVYNAVFNCCQFWNGRAKNLQQQALMAWTDDKEMGMTVEKIVKAVNGNAVYKRLFASIYHKNKITIKMILNVIAEFEKALVTPDCRFDRYLKGNKNAINKEEKRGYMLFKSYGCITCHNGVNLGGNSFQKFGVFVSHIHVEEGRDRYQVTHNPSDRYVYRVPSLRNIALTAPYLHDGSVKNLYKLVEFMGQVNLGVQIPKKDTDAIVAFLKTLTGKKPAILDNP